MITDQNPVANSRQVSVRVNWKRISHQEISKIDDYHQEAYDSTINFLQSSPCHVYRLIKIKPLLDLLFSFHLDKLVQMHNPGSIPV